MIGRWDTSLPFEIEVEGLEGVLDDDLRLADVTATGHWHVRNGEIAEKGLLG